MNKNFRHTTIFLALMSAGGAFAQSAPLQADAAQVLDSVILTGTRQAGLKAADSPAPIQILDASTLGRTGQPDLISALVQNVPSFTSEAKGGDAAALTQAVRLRGLSPNHTLILINGKRRHGTSNVNVGNGPFGGGAAADLSLIPESAIERIEILQDGAAAQYGSDAIAGVINIILKEKASGGSVTLGAGQYFKGDGDTGNLALNFGLAPSDSSFLNFSFETKNHDHSDRSDLDARYVPPYLSAANANVKNAPGYPYVNHTSGDPRIIQSLLSVNGGVDVSSAVRLYGFVTYANKQAEAIQNYRGTSIAPTVYPLGFSPIEQHDEEDFAFTGGVKGKIGAGWNYDLSTTYGSDKAKVNNFDSINQQYLRDFGTSPTRFYEGFLQSTQSTTTLDFNRDFDIGWKAPVNVAFGAEYRYDGYEIGAGDYASVYKGGAAAFPGYSTTDAGSHHRDNTALYLDLAGSPVDKLKLDLALRAEHYSDFGSATVGKLTARYDVVPSLLALRGTLNNGFRAPTLAEEYYSATSVSPTTATIVLPAASAAAKLLGLGDLKAEKSKNASFGIVATPAPKLTTSFDVYYITIKDRILQSGTLNGTVGGVVQSALVNQAIAANGNIIPISATQTGVSLYSNAADTRDVGADWVLTYSDSYGSLGRVDWTAAANFNKVKVDNIKPQPAVLGSQQIVNAVAQSSLEKSSPKYRINLGAVWRKSDWTVSLRENIFGRSSNITTFDNSVYYETNTGVKYITDLDITYQLAKAWAVTVGANNLFDVYPAKLNPEYRQILNTKGSQNVAQYPSYSPIGINGGYYYAKLNYRF